MKLAMTIVYDDETGQWGYSVPALSIVGTGCRSREEAKRLGIGAISFLMDAEGQELDDQAEIVMFDVELTPATT